MREHESNTNEHFHHHYNLMITIVIGTTLRIYKNFSMAIIKSKEMHDNEKN